MSSLLKYTKRVLTVLLTAAMVFTSVPTGVYATENDVNDAAVTEVQETVAETGSETLVEEKTDAATEEVVAEPSETDTDVVEDENTLLGDDPEPSPTPEPTPVPTLEVIGKEKASEWPTATGAGTVTVTEPNGDTPGKIVGKLTYSVNNYAPNYNESVSWHPMITSGFFIPFKAVAPEGYEVGYSFSSGDLDFSENTNELDFDLTRPWARDGKTLRLGIRKTGTTDVVLEKSYVIEVEEYTGGPIDLDLPEDLLGKNADELQTIDEIVFNPVPTSDTGKFDYGTFQDGSLYGGEGFVTGTLKYQDSYVDWGAPDGGYFFAYHINTDIKYEEGLTLSDQYKAKVYIATSEGEDFEPGQEYGWREADYNDFTGVWKVSKKPAKLVIKKTFPDNLWDGSTYDTSQDKDIYYIYDLSALDLEKTIKFDANGGTGSMAVMHNVKPETDSLPGNAFTKENCEFAGWSLTSDGPVVIDDRDDVKGLLDINPDIFANGLVTLYAQYETAGISIDAADQEFDIWPDEPYAKKVKDLQAADVVVDNVNNEIYGTLKKVSKWGAYGKTMYDGHFLTLKIEAPGATKIEAGADNYTALDDDGIIVIRIRNKDEQKARVRITYPGSVVEKEYGLSNLKLEGFELDADISEEEDFWGKKVSDLQENFAVSATGLSGDLKFIPDYSSAGFVGNNYYFAVHTDIDKDAGEEAFIVLGSGAEQPIDVDDGLIVLYIPQGTDLTGKAIKLKKTYKDGAEEIRTYSLEGLNLEPAGEMITVSAAPQDTDLFPNTGYNKTVSELQKDDIIVRRVLDEDGFFVKNEIVGTLKKVNKWTAFGPEMYTGHFLTLKVEAPGATKIEAGANNYTELDSDGIVSIYIKDKDTQKAKVKVTYGDGSFVENFYDLSGLTLEGFELNANIAADKDLYGKKVDDLQEGVKVEGNAITGTLKYVYDYSSAYGSDMSKGYYLVVQTDIAEGEKAFIISSSGTEWPINPPESPEDDFIVLYLPPAVDLDGKTIGFKKVYEGGASEVRTYSLSDLELQAPSEYSVVVEETSNTPILFKIGDPDATFTLKATVSKGEQKVKGIKVDWTVFDELDFVEVTPVGTGVTDENGVATATVTIKTSEYPDPELIEITASAVGSDIAEPLCYEVFEWTNVTNNVALNLSSQREYAFVPSFVLAEDSAFSTLWAADAEQNIASVDSDGVVTAFRTGIAGFSQMVVDADGNVVDVYGNPEATTGLLKTDGKYSVNVESSIERLEIEQLDTVFGNNTPNNSALTLHAYPETASIVGVNVTWTSSNVSVAEVSGDGFTPTIRGFKKGVTTVTASIIEGGRTIKTSTTLRVKPTVNSVEVYKQGDWENRSTYYYTSLKQGDIIKMSVEVTADDADADTRVIWESENPDIAKVDQSGQITGLKGGMAIITASTPDGKQATVNAEVSQKAEQITASLDNLVLNVGETGTIRMVTEPVTATTEYVVGETSLVTVYETMPGEFEFTAGAKKGSEVVTIADLVSGLEVKINVSVGGEKKPLQKLESDKTVFELYETQSVQLTYQATPADYTNANLSWSVTGEAAGTVVVDPTKGIVTIVDPNKIGESATVKLTATDFDGKKLAVLDYTINVVEAPAADTIVIQPKSLSLMAPLAGRPGEKATLSAKAYPETAVYKTITWTQDDPLVAQVDANGVVTAIESGSTKINAEIYNTSGVLVKKESIPVTVYDPVDGDDFATGRYNPNGAWIGAIDDYVYTGTAIKPEPNVYYGDVLLTPGVDYKLGYKNNTNAARTKNEPTVTATMKGNYAGSVTQTFAIYPADLSDVTVNSISAITKDKRGTYTEQLLKPTLTFNGKALKAGTDFDLFYMDDADEAYAAPGYWGINIYGKGNFTGEAFAEEILVDKANALNISKAVVTNVEKSYYYTGEAIEPDLQVSWKNGNLLVPLEEDEDYFITFNNNVNLGTATITITGKSGENGNYYGSKKVTFKINPYVVDIAKVADDSLKVCVNDTESDVVNGTSANTEAIPYSKSGAKPASVTLNYAGNDLVEGLDYTWTSKYDAKKDQGVITLNGKGKFFKGKATVTYVVTAQDISQMTFVVDDYVYATKADGYKKNKITVYDLDGKALKEKTDYEIVDWETEGGSSAPAVGTYVNATIKGLSVAGKSKFDPASTASISFRVISKDQKLSAASNAFMVDGEEVAASKFYVKYAGSPITMTEDDIVLKVKKKVGRTVNVITLDPSEYEIVTFLNNNKVGTATVVVRGTGEFGGLKNVTFKIKK